ncbi:hypothetical protein SSX86_003560 [Deinandra increscens subsp. villosa]|uniref:Uncharacterized protein n=1 Tax=Deinandra increscens subsp. villosa TaxID=3103831 RepID=A0AAP0H6W5_9ASTR
MAPSTKTTILISFILFLYMFSAHNDAARPVYSLHKQDGFRVHARKLSMLDAVLDYDDAGANPRHDPRRGRGGGGRNP